MKPIFQIFFQNSDAQIQKKWNWRHVTSKSSKNCPKLMFLAIFSTLHHWFSMILHIIIGGHDLMMIAGPLNLFLLFLNFHFWKRIAFFPRQMEILKIWFNFESKFYLLNCFPFLTTSFLNLKKVLLILLVAIFLMFSCIQKCFNHAKNLKIFLH